MMMRALACAAALALSAGAASAATYDAYDSFNGSAQGGAFTFGTDTGSFSSPGVVTGFTNTATGCFGQGNFLCANNGGSDTVPGIGKVTDGGSAAFQTVLVPTGVLWDHPGAAEQTDILFTAPVAGMYTFAGSAGRLDTTNNGDGWDFGFTDITGSYLDQNSIYGPGNETLSFSRMLAAGDQIAFFVNNHGAGNYYYDSAGVNVVVTGPDTSAAPEPGVWALMLTGVGLAGLALRRRRASGLAAA